MTLIIRILYELFTLVKETFEGHLKLLGYSFLGVTVGFFVLSRIATKFDFIPGLVLSVLISAYMILTILFIVLYITILFLQYCPTRKSKLKVLSKVTFFFLHILFICFFIAVPPLFSNYLVLWVTGHFDLLKTVKFWIVVLLEILTWMLMIYFNLDIKIISSCIVACESYLIFLIYRMENKAKKGKSS